MPTFPRGSAPRPCRADNVTQQTWTQTSLLSNGQSHWRRGHNCFLLGTGLGSLH